MRNNEVSIGRISAVAVAIGILAFAPLGLAYNASAQVLSEDRSEGIEQGLSLVVDEVRAQVADIIDDALSDDDVEDDYDDLVDDVAGNDDIEEDIQDSLDDAGATIADISGGDNTEIASVLTEFSENQRVIQEEELPDNITIASVDAAVTSVSIDEVAEELVLEAIIDEVLENNTDLVDEVQSVMDSFVEDALTDPDADIADLAQDVADEIEDAVDATVEEDEVADIISDMSEDDVEDAVNNDDVSTDAAAVQAVVRELEEPDGDGSTRTSGTSSSRDIQIEFLEQQIEELQARIAELESTDTASPTVSDDSGQNDTASEQRDNSTVSSDSPFQ